MPAEAQIPLLEVKEPAKEDQGSGVDPVPLDYSDCDTKSTKSTTSSKGIELDSEMFEERTLA